MLSVREDLHRDLLTGFPFPALLALSRTNLKPVCVSWPSSWLLKSYKDKSYKVIPTLDPI